MKSVKFFGKTRHSTKSVDLFQTENPKTPRSRKFGRIAAGSEKRAPNSGQKKIRVSRTFKREKVYLRVKPVRRSEEPSRKINYEIHESSFLLKESMK